MGGKASKLEITGQLDPAFEPLIEMRFIQLL